MHLIWRVTLPEDVPIDITYNMTSALHVRNIFNAFIVTSLESYRSDEYVESLLTYTIDSSIQPTKLECFITGFRNVSIDIVSAGE